MIKEADVIPKLYAYTYFKKIREEMQEYKVFSRDFDFEEFEMLCENLGALQLECLRNKREVRAVCQILNNGFEREGKFCDFADSIYHSTTRWGKCQSDEHDEDDDTEQILFPVYQTDEDTRKIVECEEWWCRGCTNASDGWDGDFDISCDMELDE